jgi:hypothetical protein
MAAFLAPSNFIFLASGLSAMLSPLKSEAYNSNAKRRLYDVNKESI